MTLQGVALLCVEVVLIWIVQVLVFDEVLEVFCLLDVVCEVRVLNGWLHVDKTVSNSHVFTDHHVLIALFLQSCSLIHYMPDLLLILAPFLVVLI